MLHEVPKKEIFIEFLRMEIILKSAFQELPAVREGGNCAAAEDVAAEDLIVLVVEQVADVKTEREPVPKMIVGGKIDKIIGFDVSHKNPA